MSGFASNRWYTFQQAKALEGHVRKGEHGTKIAFWKFVEAKGADHEGQQGEVEGGDHESNGRRTIPVLRLYCVFNAEQVAWPEGSSHVTSAKEQATTGTNDDHDRTAALVAASGADIEHQGVKACYRPTADGRPDRHARPVPVRGRLGLRRHAPP
jgi:antirestriction protein ArdC